MAPTISRETAQTLAETVAKVRLIDQQDKKLQPRYKRFYDGLKAGIADQSTEEIELYRPQLAAVNDEIDECLATVKEALDLIAKLRKDKDLMETKFDQVEQLVKVVAKTRKKLTDQASDARELDKQVDKALGDIRKGDVAIEGDLGALQAQVKNLMDKIVVVNTDTPKLEQAARKAWEQKNQKALTDAREKLIAFLKNGTTEIGLRGKLEKFRKQYPDLDRARKAELQWMFDDLERARDSVDRVERLVKELVALGQVPKEEKKAPPPPPKTFSVAEVTKIVAEFGLDTNSVDLRAKAMKIINSCPFDEWPKELAKLYKAKESDLKARLGKVRNLSFVKPTTLIDI
ncbi:MAG: hypothetical protein KIT35_05795 [Piscinibacter sp.]|uniref:hypothetical protein n=1 Tax=Piscinibacter sp. TaxID=1903157 RepID=UPI00258D836C|nr:hypothetical protein [Piscinibacter sp.]MCW5663324.1 hypothetical protein [Piscinibacter sp.]